MTKHQPVNLSVVIGDPRPRVVETLSRLIDNDGNADVVATSADPTQTATLARQVRPDVLIIDGEEGFGDPIVSFSRTFLPETRVVVLTEDIRLEESGGLGVEAQLAAISGDLWIMSLSDIDEAVRRNALPSALANAYVPAMRQKRHRDLATIEALAGAADLRESKACGNLRRVTDLALSCLERVDNSLAASEEVRLGCVLHDVGKLGIPDAILHKPGKLSSYEWLVMRRHPEIGVDLVEPIGLGSSAKEIILHHHEHWDGSGYPNGLAGQEIPIPARAFSVADAYDAMTSDRPYRRAMSRGDALQIIKSRAGRIFDEDMVDVLMSVVTIDLAESEDVLIDLTG
ncbi:MAG TPA: HD domain-containing phosphohydrolase [Actinomycetota bacterium]|nr:HD domain-containing phosphohydrolase [Actinomycetota bacterium]